MDFQLSQETLALKDLIRRLVDKYQMPLEKKLLRGERLTPEDYAPGRKAAEKKQGSVDSTCRRSTAGSSSRRLITSSSPRRTTDVSCRSSSAAASPNFCSP